MNSYLQSPSKRSSSTLLVAHVAHVALVALVGLVAAGPALAQDVVKENNSNDLNLGTSWVGGTAPTASNVAVWDNTSASGSFLLGADLEFQGIRIGDPGGVVTIGAGNILSLGSSGIDLESRSLNIVPNMLLTAAQEWTIGTGLYLDSNGNANNGGVLVDNQGHDLTINVVSVGTNISNYVNVNDLQGSGDLIKDGLGRARFTSFNNSFTGNIVLNDGVLNTGFRSTALGSGSSTLTLNGGQLTFGGNAATNYSRNTTVGGDAEIFNNNSTSNGGQSYSFGTLSMGAHTLTVNRNDRQETASPGNITFGATTLTGNGTFEVGDHGTNPAGLNQLTLGAVGESGGSRNLTKTGAGTLILTGANSYTGVTDVQAGTLELGASSDLAGTSSIQVATGATLDVAALSGGLTLGSGQSLGGAGTVSGDLVFGLGATLDFDPAQTLTVTGDLSFIDSFAVSNLNVADWSQIADDTYTLINNGGDFSNIANWGANNAADIGGGRLAYFQAGSLQLVVIPEPSFSSLLVGGFLFSAAAFRRRRH